MPPKYQSHRIKWDARLYSEADIKESYLLRIIVEGARTETRFFKECIHTSTRVRLQVIPPEENRSGPEKLLEQMKSEIRNDVSQSNRQPADQNWIVCDVDEHPYLETAIRSIAEFNSEINDGLPAIQIAISNPCFEIWLALYKRRNLNSRTVINKLRCKTALKRLVLDIDNHSSKKDFNTALFQKHTLAINQAEELDSCKHSVIPALPGTRVYRLVKEILKIDKQIDG